MDIMSKIAVAAVSVIAVILAIGFFNLFTDNSAECGVLDKDLYNHQVAYNESAKYYRYRANDLQGQFDLPGDLAAWRNHLLNEYSKLQQEISNIEERC